MEIVVFKFKSRILPVLTFSHSDLNILSYKSPFDANSFFFGFLTQRDISLPTFSRKRAHLREIWFFLDDIWIMPTDRFCEETNPNYIPKYPNRHPSLYFSNLAPLSQKSKLEDFMQGYFFIFRKIVMNYLNVNCLLRKWLFL
jgi:hypothetical protein